MNLASPRPELARRWRSLTLASVLAAGGSLAAFASASAAVVLPPATSAVTCQSAPSPDISSPSFCSKTNVHGHEQGSITLAPFVEEDVFASPGEGSVFSNLKYSFEVVGGHVGDIVPLLIETTASTISSPGGSATVQIGIVTSQGSVGRTFCASVLCSAANFSGTLSILAASGSVGTLGMNANVGGGNGPAASSADADPFIFVDPSFANAGLYSIVVSDGVGNALPTTTSPAPEPSSWLMLIAGLTGVGALRRVARRRPALPRG